MESNLESRCSQEGQEMLRLSLGYLHLILSSTRPAGRGCSQLTRRLLPIARKAQLSLDHHDGLHTDTLKRGRAHRQTGTCTGPMVSPVGTDLSRPVRPRLTQLGRCAESNSVYTACRRMVTVPAKPLTCHDDGCHYSVASFTHSITHGPFDLDPC